jgi:molybdopterin-guanine dinucleotide biosynthesis protein A
VKPFVEEAIESGELKAYAMLEAAANALAAKMRLSVDCVFRNLPWNENANMNVDHWELPGLSKVQMEAKHLWFANLNTPEEVCEAERHLQALNCFQDATSTLG